VVLPAGDVVQHTVEVTNTGNVQLRNVMLVSTLNTSGANTVTGLTAYSCSINNAAPVALASPGVTLPKGAATPDKVICTASYTFSTIGTIEAGQLAISTQVTAADMSAPAADPRTVAVPHRPQVLVQLLDAACATPSPNPNQAGETCGNAGWLCSVGSFRSLCLDLACQMRVVCVQTPLSTRPTH
jgi:uncharacterized repeat protein (TIGR01451 family)